MVVSEEQEVFVTNMNSCAVIINSNTELASKEKWWKISTNLFFFLSWQYLKYENDILISIPNQENTNMCAHNGKVLTVILIYVVRHIINWLYPSGDVLYLQLISLAYQWLS